MYVSSGNTNRSSPGSKGACSARNGCPLRISLALRLPAAERSEQRPMQHKINTIRSLCPDSIHTDVAVGDGRPRLVWMPQHAKASFLTLTGTASGARQPRGQSPQESAGLVIPAAPNLIAEDHQGLARTVRGTWISSDARRGGGAAHRRALKATP